MSMKTQDSSLKSQEDRPDKSYKSDRANRNEGGREMKCDVSQCHAACCGIVPIPREIFERNKGLIQKPFELKPFINDTVIVLTAGTEKCAFLTDDYRCAIYEDRPEICRKFGFEDHPLLKCSYFGRSKADDEYVAKAVKRILGFEK